MKASYSPGAKLYDNKYLIFEKQIYTDYDTSISILNTLISVY